MGTAAASLSPESGSPTVALVGVDESTSAILAEGFRQFGIQVTPLASEEIARLAQERFHGCVVPLDGDADLILRLVRGSALNRRIVVYGICSSLQHAMRYSRYGINAIFEYPLDHHTALRVVRSTYLLVVRELRRYVRVPLVSEAVLDTGSERLPASTIEISAGGVSLRTLSRFAVPQTVQVSFELPNLGQICARAVVCWMRHEEDMVGIRFDPSDERRLNVRQWIDDYLGG